MPHKHYYLRSEASNYRQRNIGDMKHGGLPHNDHNFAKTNQRHRTNQEPFFKHERRLRKAAGFFVPKKNCRANHAAFSFFYVYMVFRDHLEKFLRGRVDAVKRRSEYCPVR